MCKALIPKRDAVNHVNECGQMLEALSKKSQSFKDYGEGNLQQLSESMLSLQQSLDNASAQVSETSNKNFHETHALRSSLQDAQGKEMSKVGNTAVYKSTDFTQKPAWTSGSMFANIKQQMNSLADGNEDSSLPSEASEQQIGESGSSSWETVGRPKKLKDKFEKLEVSHTYAEVVDEPTLSKENWRKEPSDFSELSVPKDPEAQKKEEQNLEKFFAQMMGTEPPFKPQNSQPTTQAQV